jgi:hypothetical protein
MRIKTALIGMGALTTMLAPAAASAQTVSLDISTGRYVPAYGYGYGGYQPAYGYGRDDRSRWVARERWEDRRRSEEHRRWEDRRERRWHDDRRDRDDWRA